MKHGAMRLVPGLLIAALTGCAAQIAAPPPTAPALLHPERPLRIGIVVQADSLRIACGEPATLHGGRSRLGRFRRFRVTLAESGALDIEPMGASPYSLSDTLFIEPPPGQALGVNETAYRGAIEIFADGTGTLTVVNLVDLEEYLLGVVPLEIGNPGPASLEAVRAQAVAARTYAMSHRNRWPEQGFDLYGDVRDQAYGGTAAERPGCSQAVAATAGVVAVYQGQLIGAYYSAACGGMTAAVEETWSFPPEDYLKPHQDRRGSTDFCRFSKHYRWQERWSAAEFLALLSRNLTVEFGGDAPDGELEDVRVTAKNSSGRVGRLEIQVGGRKVQIGGDRVRWVLRRPSGAILRSSAFDIEVAHRNGRVSEVVASGAGNGHGVGMCQAGAIQMAAEGHDFRAILGHYYPGIRLGRLGERGLVLQSRRLPSSCASISPLYPPSARFRCLGRAFNVHPPCG